MSKFSFNIRYSSEDSFLKLSLHSAPLIILNEPSTLTFCAAITELVGMTVDDGVGLTITLDSKEIRKKT